MWNKLRILPLLFAALGLLAADTPGEYRYPLDGFYSLSGTFGELRPNHYHSGIDITTGQQTGFRVLAASEGYVYRLKVSPYGFGNAVYLKHTDGNFSVYAHLDHFTPELEHYVRAIQRQQSQYIQEIYPQPNEIRVAKGELIAFSGTSGSSTGPHLHFEIRDSLERIMNPMRWYPTLIKDHRPPRVDRMAFAPLADSSRVKGRFRKWRVVPTAAGGGNYALSGVLEVNGPVGIEYQGVDLLDASGSPCGIVGARLYLDDQLVFHRDLTRFDFEETRLVNIHFDFPEYLDQRRRMERVYREPGDVFPALDASPGNGFLQLTDDNVHGFRLVLLDFQGNKATVEGKLKRGSVVPVSTATYTPGNSRFAVNRSRNVLEVAVVRPGVAVAKEGLLWETDGGTKSNWSPAYRKGDTLFFIQHFSPANWPVRISAPGMSWTHDTYFADWVASDRSTRLDRTGVSAYFPAHSVFAEYLLSWKTLSRSGLALTPIETIGSPDEPLWKSFQVGFYPPKGVDTTCLVVAYRSSAGKSWEYAGSGRNAAGQVTAEWNTFGQFTLLADSTGPVVTPVNFTASKLIPASQKTLTWRAKDGFAGVDAPQIHVTLDGVWIPVSYNYKNHTLTWVMEQRPSSGKHTLRAAIGDKAGNFTTKTWEVVF